ncbi:MAG: aminotransferase class I/II-fold pyridoxal phosphate-dependent enzyme [Desulfovibrio sp.]|nr:aminotransferase class I/II-fold pyridoxal phosphate-dependent enzyme [Desulfovibrio sp.]
MQGMILAAGMGKRLKWLTRDNTKCMVNVNGVTLIDRMLHQLDACGLSRIVIVVGYEGQKLIDYIATLGIKTPITYVENPIYDRTNNIYSLALAKDWLLKEDTLLLESDLIFEDSVLAALLDDPRDTLALVDKYESWMDGTCVKLAADDSIEAFVPGKKFVFADIPQYYKTVNIYKFGRSFSENYYVPFLDAYSKALGDNEYYEQVLRVITMLDAPVIRAKRLTGQRWYEIDDIQDLDIASSIFAPRGEEKLASIEGRYGGYWRYPHMKDFCYLVNPYYPPQRLINEIKANFETLLTQYPSGMRVNSLLAAKNFGVREEHILVGNGAAELIKALMERTVGRVGFIRPTFEEYPNRFPAERSVVFNPFRNSPAYSADDVMEFFGRNPVETLVLINPDNPTGNYIPRADVLRLADWCAERKMRLVVDESFVDFADQDGSLLQDEVLEAHPGMMVVKSISKSYGVPGLRLGILASADTDLVASLKKDVAIWNINSFAEFYLQIAEKYKKDYEDGLGKFRKARADFMAALSALPHVRVYPSQANYVLVELLDGISARELTKQLLLGHDMLIKDLSAKIRLGGRQFVRIAVRSAEDNRELADALKCLLERGASTLRPGAGE